MEALSGINAQAQRAAFFPAILERHGLTIEAFSDVARIAGLEQVNASLDRAEGVFDGSGPVIGAGRRDEHIGSKHWARNTHHDDHKAVSVH